MHLIFFHDTPQEGEKNEQTATRQKQEHNKKPEKNLYQPTKTVKI